MADRNELLLVVIAEPKSSKGRQLLIPYLPIKMSGEWVRNYNST